MPGHNGRVTGGVAENQETLRERDAEGLSPFSEHPGRRGSVTAWRPPDPQVRHHRPRSSGLVGGLGGLIFSGVSATNQTAMTPRAIRLLTCVAAAFALANCNGGSAPASPSSVTPPTPSYPTLTMNLAGTVVSPDGIPLAGATVKVHPHIPGPLLEPIFITTDATGRYELTFENAEGQVNGGFAVASKPGYEDDARYLTPATHVTQTFRLYPIARLAAGTITQITLQPDDPACGFDLDFTCRTFRIVASRSGTLSLSVSPETGAAGYLQIDRSSRCCGPTASLAVAADQEVRVSVLMQETTKASHTFVLRTSLD